MRFAKTSQARQGAAGTGPLAGRLRALLLAMEYQAFARCMCALLEAMGYEDARPSGRAEWKGYNRPGGGGFDLEARIPGGLAPRRAVAQIKQFDALNVHQRSVDELRGACLRAGASEALLVTTSAFSEVVRKAASSPEPAGGLVAPVRLIGGEELLALMVRHRIGVREAAGRLDIDEAFFEAMAGPRTDEAQPKRPHGRPTIPGWRLTVTVAARPCPASKRRRTEATLRDRAGSEPTGMEGRPREGGR